VPNTAWRSAVGIGVLRPGNAASGLTSLVLLPAMA
jgi:hypothetical protein